MEKYTSPTVEILRLDSEDLITTSKGVETPETDLGYGCFYW